MVLSSGKELISTATGPVTCERAGGCKPICFLVQGCASTSPFVVLVTDTCKACAANQININALTYEKYVSATNGQMAVTWQKVSWQRPGL